MIRAQCIVHRKNKLLMVKHRHGGEEWWCLPGGNVEEGETAAEAVLRELKEECCVEGEIICRLGWYAFLPGVELDTYLVDIDHQEPKMGADLELPEGELVLADVKWLALNEISERDRAFLWAAGLLCVEEYYEEVSRWGGSISYPGGLT